jgi:arylsulfatase A-like enzyme
LVGYTNTSRDPKCDADEQLSPRGFEGVLPGLRVEADFRNDLRDWHDWVVESGGADLASSAPRDLFKADPKYSRAEQDACWGWARYSERFTDTAYLTDKAIRLLERHRRAEPWVLHVSLFRPHDPYLIPPSLHDPSAAARSPARAGRGSRTDEGSLHPYLAWQLEQPGCRPPATAADLAELRSFYYALVTEMDQQVGRLLGALSDRGELDATLILFTSDHGDQLGDHWLMGKMGFFDQSYHVPLIVRDPRAQADKSRGTVIDAFSEGVDLAPTILDYFDFPRLERFDGQSLRPLIEEGRPPAKWRNCVRWGYDFLEAALPVGDGGLGLRPGDCRLIVARDKAVTYVQFDELPNLLLDREKDGSDCFVNRAHEPEYGPIISRLSGSLRERTAAG